MLISCTSSCGRCANCRHGIYSHCETGDWILGYRVDGVQAEYVRIPHAKTSLYKLPPGVNEEVLVMLSDIFPTRFECGVLNDRVQPDNSVMVVGAGPTGLTSLLTAQFYSSMQIITIDTDAARLRMAGRLGATVRTGVSCEDVAAAVKRLTNGMGVDCAIEAVGMPATFKLCQQLVTPSGATANIGVYGVKADLHSGTLWSQNIVITTRLVDIVSTPMLLKMVRAGKLLPGQFIIHRFRLGNTFTTYDTSRGVARIQALEVIIFAQMAVHTRWVFYFMRQMP